ncbi:hypothetical protein, partial [Pseudomonas syringae]|uniref:hypothetical protein n=1 Tax=Pseudomonas syringae TaxID=317 RepID=UPI001E356244
ELQLHDAIHSSSFRRLTHVRFFLKKKSIFLSSGVSAFCSSGTLITTPPNPLQFEAFKKKAITSILSP